MSLNLIADPWIPVLDREGARRVIAPWQMADMALMRPAWPRPDLNIACLELLIGLVHLADPPADEEDWDARQAPDPDRLPRAGARGASRPCAARAHRGTRRRAGAGTGP